MKVHALLLGIFLATLITSNRISANPQQCQKQAPDTASSPCSASIASKTPIVSSSSSSSGASSGKKDSIVTSNSSSSTSGNAHACSKTASSSGSSTSSGKEKSISTSSSGSSASSGKGNACSSSSSGSSVSSGKGNASSFSSSGSSASSGKGNVSSSSSSGASASSGKGNASSSNSSGSSASSGKGNASSSSSSGSSASSGKGNASSSSSSGSSVSSGKGNASSSSSSGSFASSGKGNASSSSSSGASASSGKENASSSSSSGSSASSGKGNACSSSSSGSSVSSGKGNASSSSSSGSSVSSGKGNASSSSSSGSSASSGKGNACSSSSSGSSVSSGKGNACSSSSSGSSASSGKGNVSSSSSSGASASSGKGNASSSNSSGSSASSGKENASSCSSSGSSASSGKGNACSSSSSGSSASSGKGNVSSSSSSGASASSGKGNASSSNSSGSSASSGKGNASSSSSSGSSASSGKGNASSSSSSGASASSGKENASSSSSSGSSASSGKGNSSASSSSGSSATSGKGNASSSSSSGSFVSSGKGHSSTSSSSSSTSSSSGAGSSSSPSSSSSSSTGGAKKTTPKPKPPTKAPKKLCGVNEEWTECGAGPCPQPTCVDFGKPRICPDTPCQPGCTCKKGYYRNIKNNCVKPDQCEDNVCPALNEQYSSCVSPCGETCATMGKDLVCNYLACNEGCDCKPGFFRNSTGSCVEPKNCNCPELEYLNLNYFNCPPQTCDAIGKQFDCSSEPEDKKPACVCDRLMKRNDQGKCVPVEECPPKTCYKMNEVYAYQWPCFKEKCGSEDEPCTDSDKSGPFEPVCTCKRPDFCRNADGYCVENTGTNRCPDPNTVYKECVKPDYYQRCDGRGKPLKDLPCWESGCDCLPGMYRNFFTNKCVPEEECECPLNEHFDECQWFRRPESCEDIFQQYYVPSYYLYEKDPNCTMKCVCNWGFYRNDQGECVPLEQCPNYNCTSSEFYNNCPLYNECEACGEDCVISVPYPSVSSSNPSSSGSASQPSSSQQSGGAPSTSSAVSSKLSEDFDLIGPYISSETTCTPKCQCKWDEFCRTSSGECIRNEGPESCPKANTTYSDCRIQPYMQLCPLRGQIERPTGFYCRKGCECIEGYYRNTTLTCVASEDCECPLSEFYGCKKICEPETCEDIFTNYTECYNNMGTWSCIPACVCNEGEFRDGTGTCINYKECPCPDPNAEMVECPYKCGGGTCKDPELKTDCYSNCKDDGRAQRYGCQCKSGYVRKNLDEPKCIPLENCPIQ